MLMTCCLIVVVGILLSTEAAGLKFDEKHVGIMLPWLGRVETDGSSMGSSFMIAMKRYNYSVPFAVMPFRCDRQRSVIAEVRTPSCLTGTTIVASLREQSLPIQFECIIIIRNPVVYISKKP